MSVYGYDAITPAITLMDGRVYDIGNFTIAECMDGWARQIAEIEVEERCTEYSYRSFRFYFSQESFESRQFSLRDPNYTKQVRFVLRWLENYLPGCGVYTPTSRCCMPVMVFI